MVSGDLGWTDSTATPPQYTTHTSSNTPMPVKEIIYRSTFRNGFTLLYHRVVIDRPNPHKYTYIITAYTYQAYIKKNTIIYNHNILFRNVLLLISVM
jgi:hypothetical protein